MTAETDLYFAEEVVRRVKRSKVKGKTRQTKGLSRKKQGRLSRLPTLSLDVLFEVCSASQPVKLRVLTILANILYSRRFLYTSNRLICCDSRGSQSRFDKFL